MTENELSNFRGKNVEVILKNQKKFIGFCAVFIKALDNDPEEASIILETEYGLVEIYQNEITDLKILL